MCSFWDNPRKHLPHLGLMSLRKLGYLFFSRNLRRTMQEFRRNKGQLVNIRKVLPLFVKKRFENIELDKMYKVTMYSQRRSGWHDNYQTPFLDARNAFILWPMNDDDDEAIAILTFGIFGPNSICIYQVQGGGSCEDKLRFLRWEKMLIYIALQWAREHEIKSVHIISCEECPWYRKHMHKKLYLRYNVTAKRMGFVYRPATNTFCLTM